MTKIIVVLTIFILDHEEMTFFRCIWPHWFSPWPQNDTDLTFNLSSRSNCFWNTDAYKSLSLYNSNEGSFVAVCCICHILEQILLPPTHNSYILQISNVLYTHNFSPLYKLNVQAIRLLTSRKWNGEYGSLISWNWMSLLLVKLTAALLIMPIALDDLWSFYPHPRDGIPATLHVILLDKTCFFLWHFWYIACLAFIKLFNLTRTSTTVDYVTQLRTCYGEHLNEHFYEAPYLFIFDPKTHILHLFLH